MKRCDRVLRTAMSAFFMLSLGPSCRAEPLGVVKVVAAAGSVKITADLKSRVDDGACTAKIFLHNVATRSVSTSNASSCKIRKGTLTIEFPSAWIHGTLQTAPSPVIEESGRRSYSVDIRYAAAAAAHSSPSSHLSPTQPGATVVVPLPKQAEPSAPVVKAQRAPEPEPQSGYRSSVRSVLAWVSRLWLSVLMMGLLIWVVVMQFLHGRRIRKLIIEQEKQAAAQRLEERAPPPAPMIFRSHENQVPRRDLEDVRSGLQRQKDEFQQLRSEFENFRERMRIHSESQQEEANLLSAAVQQGSLVRSSSPSSTAVAAKSHGGAALAAIVNRWLEEGSGDRSRIAILAQSVGLDICTYQHGALDVVFSTPFNFDYPFLQNSDGPWIAATKDSEEIWIAPLGSANLRMGHAPSLLARLFDGLAEDSPSASIAAIYRPCLLIRSPAGGNLYRCKQKGLVWLDGKPKPLELAPSTIDEFCSVATAAQSGRPGTSLSSWIYRVNSLITAHERRFERVEQMLHSLTPSATDRQQDRSQKLGDILSERLANLERETALLRAELRSSPHPSRAVATPVPGHSAPSPEANTNLPDKCKGDSEGMPAVQSASAPTSPVQDIPTMPADWQEAMQQAARHIASHPEVAEIPSPPVYLARLRNLARAISSLPEACHCRVVHILRNPQRDGFELHAWEMAGDENSQCPVCGSDSVWQFGIQVQTTDASCSFLLFPLGTLSKGNYSSGYSALIAGTLDSVFSISVVTRPARLRLIPETGTHVVEQKMMFQSATLRQEVRA